MEGVAGSCVGWRALDFIEAGAYHAKNAIADPTRNFLTISRLSNDKTDVSAPKALFHAPTVISFLFTVLQSHCVYTVHTLAPRQICARKAKAVPNLQ